MDQAGWNAMKEIAASAEINARRPSVGSVVRVIEGRKWLGAEGRITWHGIDKFNKTAWKGDTAQGVLRQIKGQYGYAVRVQMDDGTTFFTQAEKVCVL